MTRESGLSDARDDVRERRGSRYGVGFGFIREIEQPGLDGRQFEYAITDGEREGTIQIVVSGTAIVALADDDPPVRTDGELNAWVLDRLYRRAGAIHRDNDRFATLLGMSPIYLSSPEV